MKKLKSILQYSEWEKYCLVILPLFLGFLSWKWFLVLPILLIFFFKRNKKLFVFSLILLGIFFGRYYGYQYQVLEHLIPTKEEKILVTDLYKENQYIGVYHKRYVLIDTKDSLEIGGIYQGDFIQEALQDSSFQYDFSYKKIFRGYGIDYKIQIKNIKKTKKIFIVHSLKYVASDYVNSHFEPKSAEYINTILLGVSSMDQEILTQYKSMNLTYLLAISGLHFSILISIFKIILKILPFSKKWKDIILSILIMFYTLFLGNIPSVIRVCISYFLKKYILIECSKIRVLSLSFLLQLCLFPYSFFRIGFYFSYLISLHILLYSKTMKKGIISSLGLSLSIFLVSLPILSNIQDKISFLSFFFTFVYSLLYEYIIIPSSLITFCIPKVSNIYSIFLSYLEKPIYYANSLDSFFIPLKSFSSFIGVLYLLGLSFYFYCVKGYSTKRRKIISTIFLCVFLICFSFAPNISLKTHGYFLSVGQGDASILIEKKCKSVIVVDCYKKVDTILYKKGIRTIDLLVISHGHEDHIGIAEELIQKFHVKRILVSQFDDSSPTRELLKKAKKKEITILYGITGSWYQISNFKIQVLSPSRLEEDLNDNSLCFLLTYQKTNILYTGDITQKIENELIKMKLPQNIQILKVPHHGSSLSSSQEFIEMVSPTISFFSVAQYNVYGFPEEETLKRYQKISTKIWISYLEGTLDYELI